MYLVLKYEYLKKNCFDNNQKSVFINYIICEFSKN
jgi:hypothetical protein